MSSRRRSQSKQYKQYKQYKQKSFRKSQSRKNKSQNLRSKSRSRSRLKYRTISPLLLGARKISPIQAMSIHYGPRTASRFLRLPHSPNYSNLFYARRH